MSKKTAKRHRKVRAGFVHRQGRGPNNPYTIQANGPARYSPLRVGGAALPAAMAQATGQPADWIEAEAQTQTLIEIQLQEAE